MLRHFPLTLSISRSDQGHPFPNRKQSMRTHNTFPSIESDTGWQPSAQLPPSPMRCIELERLSPETDATKMALANPPGVLQPLSAGSNRLHDWCCGRCLCGIFTKWFVRVCVRDRQNTKLNLLKKRVNGNGVDLVPFELFSKCVQVICFFFVIVFNICFSFYRWVIRNKILNLKDKSNKNKDVKNVKTLCESYVLLTMFLIDKHMSDRNLFQPSQMLSKKLSQIRMWFKPMLVSFWSSFLAVMASISWCANRAAERWSNIKWPLRGLGRAGLITPPT